MTNQETWDKAKEDFFGKVQPLTRATFRGREWFIDRRLKQLRATDNPHEFIQYDRETLCVYSTPKDKLVIMEGLLRPRSAGRLQLAFYGYL